MTSRRDTVGPLFGLLALVLGAGCDDASAKGAKPHAATEPVTVSAPQTGEMPLYVFVGADGVTTMDGEPILEDDKIAERAEGFHAEHPRAGAKVRCAQAALHGRAVRVLDLLRGSGIDPITLDLVDGT